MNRQSPPTGGEAARAVLWTIGHGLRDATQLKLELDANQVEELWDVRSRPASRRVKGVAKQDFERVFAGRYRWKGYALGGIKTPEITRRRPAGMTGLVRALRAGRSIAVMCAEESPERCHRELEIASEVRQIMGEQVEIRHIRAGGSWRND